MNNTSTLRLFALWPGRCWLAGRALLCALFLLLGPLVQAQTTSGNPILPNNHADPEGHYFNGRFYIYMSTDYDGNTNEELFRTYSSADLTNWRDEGIIFNLATQCAWTNKSQKQGGYAPSVVFRNGKYYFYYTAQGNIGVAVGNTPIGPFTDLGRPLMSGGFIDPMVFVDDDGQAYLYVSGYPAVLQVRRLNPDMVSLTSAPLQTMNPGPDYTEAPFLLKRNGVYYMMYSGGIYCGPNYNVKYATSNSPVGPWAYKDMVLSADSQFSGPGHHSVMQVPGCDDYYIVYHRYQKTNPNCLQGDPRRVCIDHMDFNYDGTIQKVNMTTYGVAPRLVGSACPVSPTFMSGGVYKLTHQGTNQCLDVENGSAASDTNVRQWPDNGADAQRWVVTLQADGNYKLTHRGTTQCLDVFNNSAAPGTNVQQYLDNGIDAQRWNLQAMSGGFYKLTHKNTNQCLDVLNNSPVGGANVQQYSDNGSSAQRWQLTLTDQPIVSGGVYKLTHKGTTQCLDVPGNTTSPGTALAQQTDSGSNAQRWVITRMPDGYYRLTHRNTNQCLEVLNNSPAAGAVVQQYTDNGSDAQRWQLVPTGDGYFKLVHKNTTLCLDVLQNLSNPGTAVRQWNDNGADAQRWRLDLMPSTAPSARPALAAATEAPGASGPLTIYPVPATDQVHFAVTPAQSGPLALDVFDLQGRLVRHLASEAGIQGQLTEYVLDSSTWASGAYTVRLTAAGQVTYGKLVLAR